VWACLGEKNDGVMAFENRLNSRRHANLPELPIAFAKTRCHFLTAGLDARKCDVDPKTAKGAGVHGANRDFGVSREFR